MSNYVTVMLRLDQADAILSLIANHRAACECGTCGLVDAFASQLSLTAADRRVQNAKSESRRAAHEAFANRQDAESLPRHEDADVGTDAHSSNTNPGYSE